MPPKKGQIKNDLIHFDWIKINPWPIVSDLIMELPLIT